MQNAVEFENPIVEVSSTKAGSQNDYFCHGLRPHNTGDMIRYELNDNTVATFNARRRKFGQLRVNERYFRGGCQDGGLCQFIEGHIVSEDFPCIALAMSAPILLFSSSVLEYFVSNPEQCDLLQCESECHSVFLYTHLRHILDLSTTTRKKGKLLKDLVLLPSSQVTARKFLALNEFCKSMFVPRSVYQQQGLGSMSYNDYSLYYALQAIIDDLDSGKPASPQRVIVLTLTDSAPFPDELVASSSHVSYESMSLNQYVEFLFRRECINEQDRGVYVAQIQSYLDNRSNINTLIPLGEEKSHISYKEHITWSHFLSNMKLSKYSNGSKSNVIMGIGRLYVDKHDRNHGEIRPLTIDEMTNIGLLSTGIDIHQDLYVIVRSKAEMNRAMNGDIVSFTVLRSSDDNESDQVDLPCHLKRSLSANTQVDLEVDPDDDTEQAPLTSNGEGSESLRMDGGDLLLQKYGCRVVSVSSIVQRHTDHYTIVALFPQNNSTTSVQAQPLGRRAGEETVLVRPLNKVYPFIRVRTRHRAKYSGCYVLICFDHWPMNSDFPEGHITKVITAVGGVDGSKSMKYMYHGIDLSMWSHHIEALMSQYSIQHRAFSHSARAGLPPLPSLSSDNSVNNMSDNNKGDILEWHPDTTEVTRRLDLKSIRRIFSVDPIGCQDIDDAMHVQWIDAKDLPYAPISGDVASDINDILEVGIHIADVTHFVAANSALDKEACSRGTTVYLSHQRIDMLPAVLSGNICSLHSQVDRYAVTTLFHLTVKDKHANNIPMSTIKEWSPMDILTKYDNGDIMLTEIYEAPVYFGRSVIHSTASMTYEQAHVLLHSQGTKDPGYTSTDRATAGCSILSTLWPSLSIDLAWLTIISRQCNVIRMQQAIGGLDLSVGRSTQLKFSFSSKADTLHMDPSSEETGPSDMNHTSNFKVDHDLLSERITISSDDHLEIHDTIAELMVLTNSSVAKYICDHLDILDDNDNETGSALLRIHGAPDKVRLERIQAFCDALYTTYTNNHNGDENEHFLLLFPPVESSSEVLQQLKTYRHKLYMAKSRGLLNDETIDYITSMIIRAMNEAQYIGSANVTPLDATTMDTNTSADNNNGQSSSTLKSMVHVGLGLQYYTHFTSPIRRYADVIVHRQLLFILANNGNRKSKNSKNNGELSALVDDLARMQLPASQARDILDFKKKGDSGGVDNRNIEIGDREDFPSLRCNASDERDDEKGGKGEEKIEEQKEEDSDDDDFLDALLDDVGDELLPGTVTDDNGRTSASNDNEQTVEKAVASKQPTERQPSGKIITTKTQSLLSLRRQYIASVTSHINTKNRNARLIQREMSKLFVNIYFHRLYLQSMGDNENYSHSMQDQSTHGNKGYEVCFGIIYSCLDNGLLVYLPKYDHRGPVYLKNRVGQLHLHTTLLSPLPSKVSDIFRCIANGIASTHAIDSLTVDSAKLVAMEGMETRLVSEGTSRSGGENEEMYYSTAAVLSIQSKVDKNMDGHNKSIILRPMQHVLVQVSSAISMKSEEDAVLNRFGAVPELSLSLLYAAPSDMGMTMQSSDKSKSGKINTVDTVHSPKKGIEKGKNSSQLGSDKEDATRQESVVKEAKPTKKKNSLYELLQRIQTQSDDNGDESTTNTAVKSSSRALLERVNAKQRRHQPPSKGAGRIFYGKASQCPALFDPIKANQTSVSSLSGTDEDIKQSTNSREAAYNKLKQYGEEWEEEELPSWGGNDVAQAPLGGGHYLDPQGLGGVNRKDVALAQSRINKVKTAKRNAKYK